MEQIDKSILDYGEKVFCKHCFCTLDEFIKTGFVGCEYCYDVFESEINEYILCSQKSDKHIGKLYIKGGNNNG